jgi:glycosyltransferase involved in cell wall biosynthesis
MLKISIIIPILNEEKYIDNCINSILNANIDNFELILIDGGSQDKTINIIEDYMKKYSFIQLLHNTKKIVPISMNMGIKKAEGKYIIRVDAHAFYPKDYFRKLIHYHKKLNADNIGGVIITDIKNKTKKSNSIKEVLSNRFGVGNADFRTGIDRVKEVDTVPFGCYTKETFEKFGLYDERLIRNQDIELNKRIINGGGKIYLVPDVKAVYYARENFIDLAKNNFSNGKWNILTAYYSKTVNSLSLRHFIPLVFVLSLIIPILLSFINIKFLWLAILSLGSYLALVIIISSKLVDDKNSFFYLVNSFFTLHLSYGFGSLFGIFSTIKKILKGKK